MARKAGSVAVTDNTQVKNYLKKFSNTVLIYPDYVEFVPSWLDDIMNGAAGQIAGTRRVSSYKLFCILRMLDEISTITVRALLDPKRSTITGKGYSKSMIEFYTKALRCASSGIMYHAPRYDKDFNNEETNY